MVMSTLGWRPSGQAETSVKCDAFYLIFSRGFQFLTLSLKLEPRRTSRMFFLSRTDVLMDVMLLHVGVLPVVAILPPPGPPLLPHAPPLGDGGTVTSSLTPLLDELMLSF